MGAQSLTTAVMSFWCAARRPGRIGQVTRSRERRATCFLGQPWPLPCIRLALAVAIRGPTLGPETGNNRVGNYLERVIWRRTLTLRQPITRADDRGEGCVMPDQTDDRSMNVPRARFARDGAHFENFRHKSCKHPRSLTGGQRTSRSLPSL